MKLYASGELDPRAWPLSCKVTTKPMPDGKIEQSVTMPAFRDDAHGEVMRWVMDTKEKGIREALIALGWTPPNEPGE